LSHALPKSAPFLRKIFYPFARIDAPGHFKPSRPLWKAFAQGWGFKILWAQLRFKPQPRKGFAYLSLKVWVANPGTSKPIMPPSAALRLLELPLS